MNLIGGSDRFRSNVKKIAVANVFAQALGVVTLPVLSRLFTPEHFGVLTTYSVAQSIGLSVVTGRIDWIVPNARNKRRARALMNAGVGIVAGMAVLTAVALVLAEPGIAALAGVDREPGVLWMLPLGVGAGGIQLLFQSWNVLEGDLTDIGRARSVQAVVTVGLSLAVGLWATASGFGLVAAYVAGFVASAAVLVAWARRRGLRTRRWQPARWLRVVRLYRRQMTSNTLLGLVNVLTTASMMMLLIFWYSPQIVGWYGLVFRVATAPIGLVTQALVKSFWSDAAALAKTDPRGLRSFYLATVRRLAVLGLVVAMVALAAPLYVPVVFGREDWTGAGALLAAVTPYLFGMVVFSPTTHLIVYMKAHWQVAADLTSLAVSVAVFSAVAGGGHPAWMAILATSLVLLAGYLVRFWLHLRANEVVIREGARL
jgi:O-antigen/teichoic acid export membrane protein